MLLWMSEIWVMSKLTGWLTYSLDLSPSGLGGRLGASLLTSKCICCLYCSLFCVNQRRPGRLQSEKFFFQPFGGWPRGRKPCMRSSKAIFGNWSLRMHWTWPSHLNSWTRTLFRMVVLYGSLLSRMALETQSAYVMPAVRRSSFVSNSTSHVKSSTLTVHVSQPYIAKGMMMGQNSISFNFTEIRFCFHIGIRALKLALPRARGLLMSTEWLLSLVIWLPRYLKLSTHSISALSLIFGRDGLLNLDTRMAFVLSSLIFIPKVPVTTSRFSALVWCSVTDPASISMPSAYASLSITIPLIIAPLVASTCDITQWRKRLNMWGERMHPCKTPTEV